MSNSVIVIGGGLAGLSAANEAVKRGLCAVLVEKAGLGGNSAKATSGINAVHTKAQRQGIASGQLPTDDVALFFKDIQASGYNLTKPEVARALAALSGKSVDALMDDYGLNMSDIQRLGGHSARRTHRFPPQDGRVVPVGWTIIQALKKTFLEHVAEKRAVLLDRHRVVDISISELTPGVPVITSVEVETSEGETKLLTDFSSVVIASGGFVADSSPNSILASVRPDLLGYPTTNGDFAAGDLLNIGMKRGLKTLQLDKVQLHPTGFVDSKDPLNPRKFLCPEVVRGLGAVLVNMEGKRFANELLPRDRLSDAIVTNGGDSAVWKLSDAINDKQRIALLIFNDGVADAFGRAAFNFYQSKGFIRKFTNAEELAEFAPTVSYETLKESLESYGKSAAAGEDEFGKKVFPTTFDLTEPLYAAFITPSLHFAMGGLEIDSMSRAMTAEGKPVANLFIAGEASAGVHGGNRLGGNGCLESVVFGQLSAQMAATLPSNLLDIETQQVYIPTSGSTESLRIVECHENKIIAALSQIHLILSDQSKVTKACVIDTHRGVSDNMKEYELQVESPSVIGTVTLRCEEAVAAEPGDIVEITWG